MFTSFWMPLERTTSLHLDGFSVPHPSSLPLPTSCSRDFCRCTRSPGIVRPCLFLCSLPVLNSDSCWASPTPRCWHCESNLSYEDFSNQLPKESSNVGNLNMLPFTHCFLSFPGLFSDSETNRPLDRMKNRALLRCCTI